MINKKFPLMVVRAIVLLSAALPLRLYAADDLKTSLEQESRPPHTASEKIADVTKPNEKQPSKKRKVEECTSTPIIEPTALSRAPRILMCEKVRLASRTQHTPSYAPELSQWVLDRRLSQLPKDIDPSPFQDTLKERFNYRNIWLSVTSHAVHDLKDYRLVVNHTHIDTLQDYHIVFEVFLKDAPQKLWIEGQMVASNIQFEYGLSMRDADSIDYSFHVLADTIFPKGILAKHLDEETCPKSDQLPDLRELIENILHQDQLNNLLFWDLKFIPFLNLKSRGAS